MATSRSLYILKSTTRNFPSSTLITPSAGTFSTKLFDRSLKKRGLVETPPHPQSQCLFIHSTLVRNMSSSLDDTAKEPVSVGNGAEGNDSNKREASPAKEEEAADGSHKRPKVTKKEAAKNHTRRNPRDFDEGRDDRNKPAHEGSYADPTQQKLFGIVNLDDNRVDIDDDTKTLKRKVAVLLGYLGTDYGGFQVNLAQKTIQAEMELAFYRAGMLTKLNFGVPNKYSWSSSARTDKGVHACAQVCSLKVEVLESDMDDSLKAARQRLQDRLPPDIQVLDLLRTTRNFCAHTQRDRVRYQYMIPSFLLHPNYRSLLEKHEIRLERIRDTARAVLTEFEIKKLQEDLKGYQSTEDQRKVLQSALEKYEGTRPFHNFTKGVKAGQAQAMRYIESFRIQDPVVVNGVEWIPTQVLGQSFLLHQIRKMVSLAIDVTRGAASLEFMDEALRKNRNVCVPIAPAQGLFLEMSYFGGYNRRKGSQNPDLPDLDFLQEGPARDRWEAFRTKIREHIVQEEEAQGNFLQYFYQQECMFDHKNLYKLSAEDTEESNK